MTGLEARRTKEKNGVMNELTDAADILVDLIKYINDALLTLFWTNGIPTKGS